MGLTQKLGTIPLAIQTDSSNNVGIGTTTPAERLEVFAPAVAGTSQQSRLRITQAGSISARANLVSGVISGENPYFAIETRQSASPFAIVERLRIDGNGNVGIGTTSPTGTYGKLSVAGGISILDDNNAKLEIGRYSSGAANSYIKIGANSASLRITNAADSADLVTFTNSGDVGIGGSISNQRLYVKAATSNGTTNAFLIHDSNGSDLLFVRSDGLINTGLRTQSPYNLTIAASANAYVYSDGTLFRATSSARYKKDIEDINVDTFGLINKIRPVWYRSTTGNDRDDWSWYGFIAEELAEVDPRFVHFGYAPEDYIKNEETGKTELKEGAELRADGVMYDRLTVLLIKGMQEQKKLIDELSAKVTALENTKS